MSVTITSAGNIIQVNLGDGLVSSYELSAVPNSFDINSDTLVVKSRFFHQWNLEVALSDLSINGVTPSDEAGFDTALTT